MGDITQKNITQSFYVNYADDGTTTILVDERTKYYEDNKYLSSVQNTRTITSSSDWSGERDDIKAVADKLWTS